MAEIKIQRKRPTVWPWVVGALLVGLVAWGLIAWPSDTDDRYAQIAPATESGTAATAGGDDLIPIAAILSQPTQYVNETVSGTTQVAEVISDRGFWIERQGRRMFAVIDEPPRETIDINAGQTLRLTGRVYTQETLKQIEGNIEPDTRRVVEQQPAFLYIKARDVSITGRGSGGG